jgi:cytoskeletal protein CcmA (bactofilin family)
VSDALAGWVGPGAEHVGDLVLTGRLRVDGRVRGRIRVEGLLEVGPDGVIEGEVDATQLLCGGRVLGTIAVHERATLLASAVIDGGIVTPWLDVRLGAQVRGETVVWRPATAKGRPV